MPRRRLAHRVPRTRDVRFRALGALLAVSLLASGAAHADIFFPTEHVVTTATHHETTPTLGADATGNLVVYTQQVGSQGLIQYQRLNEDGSPVGPIGRGNR